MKECGLNKVDVQDWVNWRRLLWDPTNQPPHKEKGSGVKFIPECDFNSYELMV